MLARRTALRSPRSRGWITRSLVLALVATCGSLRGQQVKPAPKTGTASSAARQRFLEMWARAYFPGRTGQLLVVPREGDILTRPEPDATYMHGSPWPYDVSIPVMFAGPAVRPGTYAMPASQQDVAPTLAAALGLRMPHATTGRVLPVLRKDFARPRAVMLLVLDGMRRDYFDRYTDVMPTLAALRRRGAWFARAEMNILPTNTAVGHSTISTGTDPRIHGVTGTNLWDTRNHRREDLYKSQNPEPLLALTLADLWSVATAGQAVILAQGSASRAATPLAGHGACQLNGAAVVLASYDFDEGRWKTNERCFRLPAYLKDLDAKTLWADSPEWMGHRIDSASAVRYSALFPRFEAEAMAAMIEREPVGADGIPDLILMNYKCADYVGHMYGPDSPELHATLGAMDAQLARLLEALEAKVGDDYLLAVTADHGMPPEPPSPDRRHLTPSLVEALHQKFDPDAKKLVTTYEPENSQLFVDEGRLAELGLTLNDLAAFLASQPFIFAVYTNEEVARAAARMPKPEPTGEPKLKPKPAPPPS